jgi:cysteine desulfurase
MSSLVYLDYAAATPLAPEVLAVMQPYFSASFYNPSATYLAAQSVKKDIDKARSAMAQILGARQPEIIFTAGGTEANNLAIRGVMEQFPEGNVVVSAIEHESVLAPAELYDCRLAPVTPDGRIDLPKLISLIDEQTVLVSIMYANNEIGTIEPLRDIAKALDVVRRARKASGNTRPLYFHSDAAQAGNYLDLHVSRLGVDLMTLNGGKIYGPKASGALYVASHVRLTPLLLGGGQERGLRSGTQNVPAIIGFATALELAQGQRASESARLRLLQEEAFKLLATKLPGAVINGSRTHRLPNNVHITIPGQDNERLLFGLDELGIMAAAGSACSASDEEPSHVLTALGLSKEDAQASLRLSFGRSTDGKAIVQAITALARLIA